VGGGGGGGGGGRGKTGLYQSRTEDYGGYTDPRQQRKGDEEVAKGSGSTRIEAKKKKSRKRVQVRARGGEG